MTKSFLKFRTRILFLSSFVVLLWAGLAMRYLYIQVFRSNNFSEIVRIQGEEKILLPAIRGTIHDRKYRPLAENVIHYDFAIHPNRIENRDLIVSTFSTVTGRSLWRSRYSDLHQRKRGCTFTATRICSNSSVRIPGSSYRTDTANSRRRSQGRQPVARPGR